MRGFLEALRLQRYDDHRYYHHSRINQSLHLLSALSFLLAYVLVFKNPGSRRADRLAICHGGPSGRSFLLRAQGL